jgi:hypothetical protein
MTFLSRLWQNRNRDSCEKNPQEQKNRNSRIPAGITYLAAHLKWNTWGTYSQKMALNLRVIRFRQYYL